MGNRDPERPRLYGSRQCRRATGRHHHETLARKYWPNTDPIGQRMRYPGPWTNTLDAGVGVVQDVKHEMNLPVTSEFYIRTLRMPGNQWSWSRKQESIRRDGRAYSRAGLVNR